MFTTGSKLFLGATGLSIVGAIVVGQTTGGPTGYLGTLGLIFMACVFAFLTGINFFIRDGNVSAMEEGVQLTAAAAQPPVGRSGWPFVASIGVGGLVVGAVSQPVVFKVSLIVVLAAVVEWMVQAWSERASADTAYNATIRKRVLHPLEFPIMAAVGLGLLIYAFSRIMLSVNKDAGLWVFITIGAVIVAVGFVFAARRGVGKGTIAGIISVGAIALVGVGVASAVQGQRPIEPHPEITSAVCLGTASDAETEEIDKKSSQAVAAKSSVLAYIELSKDDRLIAFVNGMPNVEYHELTVPRSDTVHVLFRNNSSEFRRLTVHLGTFKATDGTEGTEQADCTTEVKPGGEGFLTFQFPKLELASTTPYRLTVPGVDGQEIKIVVP